MLIIKEGLISFMTIHEEQKKRTNEIIINSLINLAEIKPLSKISISDITKLGKINRGTFYLHYESKEDLIESLESKTLKEVNIIIDKNIKETMDINFFYNNEPYPIIRLLADYVSEHKKIFNFLLNSNTTIFFRNSIKLILEDVVTKSLINAKKSSQISSVIPYSYALEIISSIIMSIFMKWIEGYDELTPEEVSKLIMDSLFLSPYDMLGLKK